jgi:hypothetical protein
MVMTTIQVIRMATPHERGVPPGPPLLSLLQNPQTAATILATASHKEGLTSGETGSTEKLANSSMVGAKIVGFLRRHPSNLLTGNKVLMAEFEVTKATSNVVVLGS